MIIVRKIWVNNTNKQKMITIPASSTLKKDDSVFIGTVPEEISKELIKDQIIKLNNKDFETIHLFIMKQYRERIKTIGGIN